MGLMGVLTEPVTKEIYPSRRLRVYDKTRKSAARRRLLYGAMLSMFGDRGTSDRRSVASQDRHGHGLAATRAHEKDKKKGA